ncbi:hypothetical protein GCM10009639_49820 [Kitasatospora putterlickiae]|uniref:HTH cro/C1-type domain-containing protein n=1 Tax=Kitasatospora putterlickiae TaxID=221725 RepID=A0ABN1YCP2_9ACTN
MVYTPEHRWKPDAGGRVSTEDLGPGEALVELRRRLDDKRAVLGLDKTQFARRAGVSRGTIHNALTGPVPRAETITALAEALGLDPRVLLKLRQIAAGEAPAPAGPRAQRPTGGRPLADRALLSQRSR